MATLDVIMPDNDGLLLHFQGSSRFRPHRHSPSLSNHRCDLHILLNAISILLFGIINPLPLLQFKHPKKEAVSHAKNS